MDFNNIQKKAVAKWENLVNSKDPVIYYGAASCGRAAGSLASKKVIEDTLKKLKIKGKEYWYLFHTVRKGQKFLKKSRYLGKTIPKNIEQIKADFLKEIKQPKLRDKNTILIESFTPLERKVLPALKATKELL